MADIHDTNNAPANQDELPEELPVKEALRAACEGLDALRLRAYDVVSGFPHSDDLSPDEDDLRTEIRSISARLFRDSRRMVQSIIKEIDSLSGEFDRIEERLGEEL
jgi:hypothetical protein